MLLNRLGEKETLAIPLHSGYGCVIRDAPTVYAYGYGYGHGSGSGFEPCGRGHSAGAAMICIDTMYGTGTGNCTYAKIK